MDITGAALPTERGGSVGDLALGSQADGLEARGGGDWTGFDVDVNK